MEEGKKIFACVGPESTGKTTIAQQLAMHFNGTVVPEFAREYLDRKGGNYEQSDLLTIAENQLALERRIISKNDGPIFCDSDILTIIIWHQFKYGNRNKEIERLFKEHPPRKYLLFYPDLPWEPDPLRENPDDLKAIFKVYKYHLKEIAPDHSVIDGTGDQRLQNAINAVNQFDLG